MKLLGLIIAAQAARNALVATRTMRAGLAYTTALARLVAAVRPGPIPPPEERTRASLERWDGALRAMATWPAPRGEA